jgi:hypothetical protein
MFETGIDTEHLFAQHVRMHRTYVRRRRTMAVAATALIAVLLSPLAAAAVRPGDDAPPAPPSSVVVVRDGDTLWSIALRARPGDDPRATILEIQQRNGVDAGSIVPGMTLQVPAA